VRAMGHTLTRENAFKRACQLLWRRKSHLVMDALSLLLCLVMALTGGAAVRLAAALRTQRTVQGAQGGARCAASIGAGCRCLSLQRPVSGSAARPAWGRARPMARRVGCVQDG
jgi:hypothetical protein